MASSGLSVWLARGLKPRSLVLVLAGCVSADKSAGFIGCRYLLQLNRTIKPECQSLDCATIALLLMLYAM